MGFLPPTWIGYTPSSIPCKYTDTNLLASTNAGQEAANYSPNKVAHRGATTI